MGFYGLTDVLKLDIFSSLMKIKIKNTYITLLFEIQNFLLVVTLKIRLINTRTTSIAFYQKFLGE